MHELRYLIFIDCAIKYKLLFYLIVVLFNDYPYLNEHSCHFSLKSEKVEILTFWTFLGP